MSESEETADDTDETETEDTGSSDEPASSGNQSGNGILTTDEQELMKEWVPYLAGVFAAVGVALGLDVIVQNRWNHQLVFATGPGVNNMPVTASPRLFLTVSIPVVVVTSLLIAMRVSNEEYTAAKLVAVTSLVSMIVIGVLSGLVGAVPPGGTNLDLINTLVSSIGSGIAAAVGSLIVVFVTDEFAPESFDL